jgi:hypothetical protein
MKNMSYWNLILLFVLIMMFVISMSLVLLNASLNDVELRVDSLERSIILIPFIYGYRKSI